MTNTSNPSYARFIPREELDGFAAWRPDAFGDSGAARTPGAEARRSADQQAGLHAARQAGYQDGYRDGLVALEGFKQSFAMQTTHQVGALVDSLAGQLEALQQQMAQALAATATELARQIVRSELVARPELIATIAQEAIDTLLLSARHITLRVHPDDHAFVAQGAADVLAARGARLLADPLMSRGGCLVESDIGVIDATLETRWRRAAASLGCDEGWAADSAPEADA